MLAKFGGKLGLDEAIAAGRVIATKNKSGLMMYFVPRWEYTRENLYRQQVSGTATQASDNIDHLLDDQGLGFNWEPAKFIPPAISEKFGAFDMPKLGAGPGSMGPLALGGPEGLYMHVWLS